MSEVSTYGNKSAWTAMLNYPANCPVGNPPPTPVLALYTDATYYTQGDWGTINYTAADVSSLSLNETPASDIYSCETGHSIQPPGGPLVGSCAALNVTMTNTTSQITLFGVNTDVEGSPSGNQTQGSASINVTVGPNPIITKVRDANTGQSCDFDVDPSCVITANQYDTLEIDGRGFSLSGGNTVYLPGAGWLFEGDQYSFSDASRTQINAQIACYIPPGNWTFNVWNPHNGNPSASYSINIVASSSCQ